MLKLVLISLLVLPASALADSKVWTCEYLSDRGDADVFKFRVKRELKSLSPVLEAQAELYPNLRQILNERKRLVNSYTSKLLDYCVSHPRIYQRFAKRYKEKPYPPFPCEEIERSIDYLSATLPSFEAMKMKLDSVFPVEYFNGLLRVRDKERKILAKFKIEHPELGPHDTLEQERIAVFGKGENLDADDNFIWRHLAKETKAEMLSLAENCHRDADLKESYMIQRYQCGPGYPDPNGHERNEPPRASYCQGFTSIWKAPSKAP